MFKEQFSGKRVLVTGAGRGLGRALAKRLHGYGAKVIALSRTEETLKSLQKECPGIETLCVDLANWDESRKVLNKLEAVDCLVNNAAILVMKSLMNTSPEDFDKTYNINLKSILNTSQIVAGKMLEAGKSGSIVNISSVAGSRPAMYMGAYSTMKAALQLMSQCLAVELAPKGIRVNCFQPAGIGTDMINELTQGLEEVTHTPGIYEMVMKMRTPTTCTIMPMEECLNCILFLLSDLTTQIVGHNLTLDGGYLCT